MKRLTCLGFFLLAACDEPKPQGVTFDERFGPCYIHCVQGGVRDPQQIHYRCVKMCRQCLRDNPRTCHRDINQD